jgi:intergrase/recombinase
MIKKSLAAKIKARPGALLSLFKNYNFDYTEETPENVIEAFNYIDSQNSGLARQFASKVYSFDCHNFNGNDLTEWMNKLRRGIDITENIQDNFFPSDEEKKAKEEAAKKEEQDKNRNTTKFLVVGSTLIVAIIILILIFKK